MYLNVLRVIKEKINSRTAHDYDNTVAVRVLKRDAIYIDTFNICRVILAEYLEYLATVTI